MRTYPIRDEAGVIFAFEIDIPARGFATLLRGISGVSDVRERPVFAGSDVHVWFRYHDRACIAWEPFGDNSRWWIGPEDTQPPHWSIAELEEAVAGL